MPTWPEKWMVIHDASRNDGLSAIILGFDSIPVRSGDELTLLGVFHQLSSPLKIKSMIDGSGSNGNVKDYEQMKKEEYLKREDVMELSKICTAKKIIFHIDVQAASSPRNAAATAAKSLKVTWVVLDRQMKKDKRYFMDKLKCGILRMKSSNTIEKLRGPILIEDKKPMRRTLSSEHVSYGEMIPQMSKQRDSKKSKIHIFISFAANIRGKMGGSGRWATETSGQKTTNLPKQEDCISGDTSKRNLSNFEIDPKNEQAPPESKDIIEVEFDEQTEFEYSVCSVCQNKRPSMRLKRDFNYAELQQVTNNFSSTNFLSEGGFGSVYKGEMIGGLKVAVKQHKDASSQGEKEFKSEVNVLSKARHPNLVVLLGSCSEGTHRLLVYEFVCNGSLDQHLSRPELTWDKRIKIALGAARGLDYLHRINIIHRDMRPNNILVTHDYEALLGDFGLARTDCVDTDSTGVVGTLGYVAPEYAECGKVSTKTDVYSFGVVLLQLITGCRTREEKFEGKTLVEWARPLLEEKNFPVLIDEKILDVHVFQLYLMVKLVDGCLKKDPSKRETMQDVVQELECIKMGTTRYRDLKQC
ncbi:uncharacterized protein [Rutidosis leptorrhynchoides]|uniref:uncharacterized protein n=1 Tax=Rutidosis leptorrhynchoides TaxID=125765 RepID=UPI003A9A6664